MSRLPFACDCMSFLVSHLPAKVSEWTACDVRRWSEAKLAARFPGQSFCEMLSVVENLHMIDGGILVDLQDPEWREAIPSIGARKVLRQEVARLSASFCLEETLVAPRDTSSTITSTVRDSGKCTAESCTKTLDVTAVGVALAAPQGNRTADTADGIAAEFIGSRMISGTSTCSPKIRDTFEHVLDRPAASPREPPLQAQRLSVSSTSAQVPQQATQERATICAFPQRKPSPRLVRFDRVEEDPATQHVSTSLYRPRSPGPTFLGVLRGKTNAVGHRQSGIWGQSCDFQGSTNPLQGGEEGQSEVYARFPELQKTSCFSNLPILDCHYQHQVAADGPLLQRLRGHCVYWGCNMVYFGQCIFRLLDRWQLLWCTVCCGLVALCQYSSIVSAVPPSLWVNALLFPLAFSVNAAYQRREGALSQSAEFKACCLTLYLSHRCWQFERTVPHDFLRCSSTCFTTLFEKVKGYLIAKTEGEKVAQLRAVYDLLNELSLVNDVLRISKIDAPLIASLTSTMGRLVGSFESLRMYSDYRTPSSIRAFVHLCNVLVPLLLIPNFAQLATEHNPYAAYAAGFLLPFLFMLLSNVQKGLENPFADPEIINPDGIQLQSLQMVRYMSEGKMFADSRNRRQDATQDTLEAATVDEVAERTATCSCPHQSTGTVSV